MTEGSTFPLFGEPSELHEHVEKLREQLTDAEDTHRRLVDAAANSEPADGWGSFLESWRSGLRYGIELELAARRVDWWRQLVAAAEARVRDL